MPCNRCCCCCRNGKSSSSLTPPDAESMHFMDGAISSSPAGNTFTPKKSWLQLHEEWDAEPPKNPGKILFLYSPDSPAFKVNKVLKGQ